MKQQQFRSKDGCCICATKSSTTRFQPSEEYEAHFGSVFGARARARTGCLCNPCLLCVKRALARKGPARSPPYAGVLDSRRGTGPKHMKQICKRNRRREQREAAAKATAANSRLAVGSRAAAAAAVADAAGHSGVVAGSAGREATIEARNHHPDAGAAAPASAAAAAAAAGAAASAVAAAAPAATATAGRNGSEFRAPLAPGSGAAGARHYYKKRVILQPVKSPDSREVSELFQDVMRSRELDPSEGPLSCQQVHSAFLNTKRRRLLASGSETASVLSTEPAESFTSDTGSSMTDVSLAARQL